MALNVTNMEREFLWEGKTIKDPARHLGPEEVRKHLSGKYPLMTTARVDGPEIVEEEGRRKAIYTISKSSGTLG